MNDHWFDELSFGIELEASDASDAHLSRELELEAVRDGERSEPIEMTIPDLESPDDDVRTAALGALATVAPDHVWMLGRSLLEDASNAVRISALRIFTQASPANAATTARKWLSEDYWGIRESAAAALGVCGDGRDAEALIHACEDLDEDVRAAALGALEKVAPDRAPSIALRLSSDRYLCVRLQAVRTLLGTRSLPAKQVRLLLHDESQEIVRAAVDHLVESEGEDAAIDALQNALEQVTRSQATTIANALLLLRPDARETVADRARRLASEPPPAAQTACELLELVGSRADLPLLEELSKSGQARVRSAAMTAARRLAPDQGDRLRLAAARKGVDDPSWRERQSSVATIGELGGPEDIDLLASKLQDRDEDVRAAALAALQAIAPDQALDGALTLLDDPHETVVERARDILTGAGSPHVVPKLRAAAGSPVHRIRARAIGILGAIGTPGDLKLLKARLVDGSSQVRAAAFDAVCKLDPEAGLAAASAVLRDPSAATRARAVRSLSAHCGDSAADLLEPLVEDDHPSVRAAAFEAMVAMENPQVPEVSRRLCTDGHEEVAAIAIDQLAAELGEEELARTLLERLPRAEGESVFPLVSTLRRLIPERLDDIAWVLASSPNPSAHQVAADLAFREDFAFDDSVLNPFAVSTNPDARIVALRSIRRLPEDRRLEVVAAALRDDDWEVRLHAMRSLSDLDLDPVRATDLLLPLMRDDDEDVRQEALKILATHDDSRILSEVFSSLSDEDEDVRETAEKLLAGGTDSVPALRHLPEGEDARGIVAAVDSVKTWASEVGRQLLGCPVDVRQYRQGVGRTGAAPGSNRVVIEVSDTALTSGHPHGEQIMRGIALHEIGHHLCDYRARGFRTANGIARSEGLQRIFDILLDERLERALRSRRPEWGVYFDRLASFVFAQKVHTAPVEDYAEFLEEDPTDVVVKVQRGELPGRIVELRRSGQVRVAFRDIDMLAVPGAVPPILAFLACLRCGIDPRIHPDSCVAEAVATVPSDLKSLRHPQVLEVAREIGNRVGREPRHRREMQQLRRNLANMQRLLRGLREVMRRLEGLSSMALPSGDESDAGGRHRPPAPVSLGSPPASPHGDPTDAVNLNQEESYNQITETEELPFQPDAHAAIVGSIRPHIRRLRGYLERIGTQTIDEYGSRHGSRIDIVQARKIVWRPTTNLLVHSRDETAPDLYLGLLIDRSGSMNGDKIARARAFGTLLCESARGLRGIEGHVNAFDDETFFALGNLQHNTIASLESGGGNNDAGALDRAAGLALRSRRRHRIVVMISDGQPTECSFEALQALVRRLTTRHGLVCAQVAVDSLARVAFPHFVDLTRYDFHESVSRFGRLLIRLASA